MRLIKELLQLNEVHTPVELADIVKNFPKFHDKALAKLWGTERLTWHGKPFFTEHSLGAAYKEAEQAVQHTIENADDIDCRIEVVFAPEFPKIDSEDFSWEGSLKKQNGGDLQEVYLGYDPKRDVLFIGFDAWVDEENFNQKWDAWFEEQTGEQFDNEIPAHDKVFSRAWKEYSDSCLGFFGVIYEVTSDFKAEEALLPMTGGFYKGMFKDFKSKYPNIIDLRLD